MKKSLFPFVIIVALLWNAGTAFSKDKGTGDAGRSKQPKNVQENRKGQQDNADKTKGQGKVARTRRQEQFRQAVGKQKSSSDSNQPGAKFAKPKKKSPVAEKDTGQGRLHQQQLKALEGQNLHEQAKHLWRLARLNRIRQLATQENGAKTVERVDKLLQMEGQRYSREQQRVQEKKQKVLQFADRSLNQQTPDRNIRGQAPEATKKGPENKKPDAKEPNKVESQKNK
jgi:hypothetical protein